MNSSATATGKAKGPGRPWFIGLLIAGVVGLAALVWWPPRQAGVTPERGELQAVPAPPQASGVPSGVGLVPEERPRSRQLLQVIEWIPAGFPVALALDLGALRKYTWTRAFGFLVSGPAFRRHLDVLQLDASSFETLGLGVDPSRPPLAWSGRSLQLSFVPHVLLLRGRQGRMDLLRRFWQNRQGSAPLQVGQYQLFFPLRHEPHLVIGAWRADLQATVGLVERTLNLSTVCGETRCRERFEKMQSWAHFLGVFSPRVPVRLSATSQIKSILVTGEWNPDGVLLQGLFSLVGSCPEAVSRIRETVRKGLNAWKLDEVFLNRAHFGCGDGGDLHVTLPVSVHEIQRQLMLFGVRP
jgi:hypothetical protein